VGVDLAIFVGSFRRCRTIKRRRIPEPTRSFGAPGRATPASPHRPHGAAPLFGHGGRHRRLFVHDENPRCYNSDVPDVVLSHFVWSCLFRLSKTKRHIGGSDEGSSPVQAKSECPILLVLARSITLKNESRHGSVKNPPSVQVCRRGPQSPAGILRQGLKKNPARDTITLPTPPLDSWGLAWERGSWPRFQLSRGRASTSGIANASI
jgi:hypothetical protein